jgi:hypothetical protein
MGYPGETDINPVEFHPQLSCDRHSVDVVLVDAGSFWWRMSLMAAFKT